MAHATAHHPTSAPCTNPFISSQFGVFDGSDEGASAGDAADSADSGDGGSNGDIDGDGGGSRLLRRVDAFGE